MLHSSASRRSDTGTVLETQLQGRFHRAGISARYAFPPAPRNYARQNEEA